MKPRIILAGGTGFVGHALTPSLLHHGYEVVVLTRQEPHRDGDLCHAQWDGKDIGDWAGLVDGAFGIINLTGRSINTRHTAANRREILESRINSVRVLGEAMARATVKPNVFVQASGVGFYGETGDRICDESCPPGRDFPAEVCRRWEEALEKIDASETRKVILRLGVVLGPDGGFLKVLGLLTKLFLGGRVGNGRQFISWIHISDLCCMFGLALERAEVNGVLNATAPNPVTNAELMRELRHALHRPWSPPVPVFAARIGSWLIGTEASLALTSQRSIPSRFLEHGFRFDFSDVRSALHHIYTRL